jgi:hypothetical protein
MESSPDGDCRRELMNEGFSVLDNINAQNNVHDLLSHIESHWAPTDRAELDGSENWKRKIIDELVLLIS